MSTIAEKIKGLVKTIKRGIERFPMAVLFAAAFTVITMILNHDGFSSINDKVKFFICWYPATGFVLAVSMKLWYEEHADNKLVLASAIGIHLLWIGISILIAHNEEQLGYAPWTFIIAALIVALVLSVILLPFNREHDDVPFWNFTFRTIGAGVVAFVVSGIVYLGLELLLFSFKNLFDIEIDSKIHADLACICFLFVAPILLIQAIPYGAAKHDDAPISMPGLIRNAVTKLFTPIAATYIITLYCYAIKILFTWQLPRGWVSWLVSVSMLVMLLLIMIVYPYLRQGETSESGYNRFAIRFITRYMPRLILPLLLLMSIGIIKRVSDYGITILRVYLIIFNVWCYAVCISLIIRKEARIKWIPTSFIVVFAGITVLPVNVSSCVKHSLLNKVDAILAESGWNGTVMDNDQYRKWLDSLEPEKATKADSRISYLKRQYSRQTVSFIIEDGVLTGGRAEAPKEKESEKNLLEMDCYRNILENVDFQIPDSVNLIRMVRGTFDIKADDYKDGFLTVKLDFDNNDSGKEYYTFRFRISELESLKDNATDMIHPEGYAVRHTGIREGSPNTKVYLYISTFWIRLDSQEDGHFGLSGLLFTEKKHKGV